MKTRSTCSNMLRTAPASSPSLTNDDDDDDDEEDDDNADVISVEVESFVVTATRASLAPNPWSSPAFDNPGCVTILIMTPSRASISITATAW